MKKFTQDNIRSLVSEISESFRPYISLHSHNNSVSLLDAPNEGRPAAVQLEQKQVQCDHGTPTLDAQQIERDSPQHVNSEFVALKEANGKLNQRLFQLADERQEMLNHQIETQQLLEQKDDQIFQLRLKLHGLDTVHHKCLELQKQNGELIAQNEAVNEINRQKSNLVSKLAEQVNQLSIKAERADQLDKKLAQLEAIRKQQDDEMIRVKAEMYHQAGDMERLKEENLNLQFRIKQLEEQVAIQQRQMEDYYLVRHDNERLSLQAQGNRIKLDQLNDMLNEIEYRRLHAGQKEVQTSTAGRDGELPGNNIRACLPRPRKATPAGGGLGLPAALSCDGGEETPEKETRLDSRGQGMACDVNGTGRHGMETLDAESMGAGQAQAE